MKRKQYNTRKIRTFMLFLFLACAIWILTKFSKEYTATISGDLNYISLPSNSVLGDGNVQNISFDITANGFEFLQYQLKKPTIDIRVSDFYSEEDKTAVIDKVELSRIVSSELDKAIAVKDISVQQLNIKLDVVASRKLVVKARAQLSFQDGYQMVGTYRLVPDSVLVTGPRNVLEGLTELYTEEVVVEKLDSDLSRKVRIEGPGNVKITMEPKVVELKVSVVEFTQKSLSVPIQLINVPENTTVKLIPEVLNITFDVSVADFNAVTAADFLVVCDFAEKNNDENFMRAKVTRQPDNINNLEFSEKKIDFLIFK